MARWLYTVLIIAVFTITKSAGHHIIRVIILAALGLAGLYMIHNLAQDFQKIYQTIQQGGGGRPWFTKRAANYSSFYLVEETTEFPQVVFVLTIDSFSIRKSIGFCFILFFFKLLLFYMFWISH